MSRRPGLLDAHLRSFPLARQRCEEAIAIADAHGWGTEPFVGVALVVLGYRGLGGSVRRWTALAGSCRASPTSRGGACDHTGPPLGERVALPGRGRHEQALREFRAAERPQARFARPPMLTIQMRALRLLTQLRLGEAAAARATLTEKRLHPRATRSAFAGGWARPCSLPSPPCAPRRKAP